MAVPRQWLVLMFIVAAVAQDIQIPGLNDPPSPEVLPPPSPPPPPSPRTQIGIITDIPALPPFALNPAPPRPISPPSPPRGSLTCDSTNLLPVFAGFNGTWHDETQQEGMTACFQVDMTANLFQNQSGAITRGAISGVYMNGLQDLRVLANRSLCEELALKALANAGWESLHQQKDLPLPGQIQSASFTNVRCCYVNRCNQNGTGLHTVYQYTLGAAGLAASLRLVVLSAATALLLSLLLGA